MRRSLTGALMALLTLQSSGAALANAPVSGAVVPGTDLASLTQPILAAIARSHIVAQLTGNGDRYAAMHAPVPHIALPRAVDAAAILARVHPLRPRVRVGTPERVVMPARSALDPRHRRLDPLAMRRSSVPALTLATGTGIERRWTYEERAIPGIGKAMVNVGTGNLLVSAMDVDIPERGLDLAFQRVYNSQSLHDYNGDDGGDRAIYGNRWTNTFDANVVYNQSANTFTVYDIDATACTYTSDGDGNWVPCTGEHATLAPTDSTDCTYAWTKKNGTVYWFHADNSGGTGCSIPQAKKGRLQEILAFNPTSINVHLGSVDALPAAIKAQALEQGLVNDIGTAATLAGLIGSPAQQYEAATARNHDFGTGDDKLYRCICEPLVAWTAPPSPRLLGEHSSDEA